MSFFALFDRFGQILRRIDEMEKDYFKDKSKSPRLFILTGSYFHDCFYLDSLYFLYILCQAIFSKSSHVEPLHFT